MDNHADDCGIRGSGRCDCGEWEMAKNTAGNLLRPDDLVGSRVIVQAASGGGKTYVIRRILELTHGRMQHFVLDVEDELFTLREKFDYVLVGGDGADVPITEASAGQLAHKLLELGASAILQLNDLGLEGQRRMIAAFVSGLMSAPRELWHPVLVTLDEAHRYVPNPKAAVASSEALTNLATAGRKRGFAAIFATQRLSQLSTDIRGQCPNRIIGRVDQALDRRAAADVLGFAPSSEEALGLMALKHKFWVVGPAFTAEPTLHQFSPAITTHLQVGHRDVPTPPTPARLKAMLGALADSVAAEEPVAEEMTARRKPPASGDPRAPVGASGERLPADKAALDRAYAAGVADATAAGVALADAFSHRLPRLRAAVRELQLSVDNELRELEEAARAYREHTTSALREEATEKLAAGRGGAGVVPVEILAGAAAPVPPRKKPSSTSAAAPALPPQSRDELSAAARRFLDEAQKRWPCKFTWSQLGVLVGRKTRGGSFNEARRQLIDGGFVTEDGALVSPTGQPDRPMPSREELRELWINALPPPADELLAAVIEANGPISAVDLAARTNRQPRGGSWNTALSMLKSNSLIVEQTRGVFVLAI